MKLEKIIIKKKFKTKQIAIKVRIRFNIKIN
jgi:hypothetical protein